MQKTIISWATDTWNPFGGCSRVSDGCKFCYAEILSLRYGHTKSAWTLQNEAANVTIKPHKIGEPFVLKEPSRVFVNSMSDMFHRMIPDWYRAAVFNVMLSLPQHIFQILTKRPESTVDWHTRYLEAVKTPEYRQLAETHKSAKVRAALNTVHETPWGDNLWMGTSVEDARVVKRIDYLRQSGAKTRFLSCEPLIGSLGEVDLTGISWVIVGGESGHHLTGPDHYRWLKQEWARELRDTCVKQGVAYFYKQDSGKVTEQRPYLVHEDGTFWRWWQFPNDLAAPVQVNAKGEPLPVDKNPDPSPVVEQDISADKKLFNYDDYKPTMMLMLPASTSANIAPVAPYKPQLWDVVRIISGFYGGSELQIIAIDGDTFDLEGKEGDGITKSVGKIKHIGAEHLELITRFSFDTSLIYDQPALPHPLPADVIRIELDCFISTERRYALYNPLGDRVDRYFEKHRLHMFDATTFWLNTDAWKLIGIKPHEMIWVRADHYVPEPPKPRNPILCEDCHHDFGTPEERKANTQAEVIIHVNNGDTPLCGKCFSERNRSTALPTPEPVPASNTAFAPKPKVTPLRQQYLDIKAQHPNAILLFRLGDFYETFDKDAEIAAEVCNLVLTARPVNRNERVPMAGFPHHAVEQYIAFLLKAGHKVAVCDQIGEPNGQLVERNVTRVLSPTEYKDPSGRPVALGVGTMPDFVNVPPSDEQSVDPTPAATKPTRVVSFHDVKDHWNQVTQQWDSDDYLYIGRRNAFYNLPESIWHNPHTAGGALPPVELYRKQLTASPKLLARIEELRGKILVCWCKSEAKPNTACHGDVLLELLGETLVAPVPTPAAAPAVTEVNPNEPAQLRMF
jgi:protein gp37